MMDQNRFPQIVTKFAQSCKNKRRDEEIDLAAKCEEIRVIMSLRIKMKLVRAQVKEKSLAQIGK